MMREQRGREVDTVIGRRLASVFARFAGLRQRATFVHGMNSAIGAGDSAVALGATAAFAIPHRPRRKQSTPVRSAKV